MNETHLKQPGFTHSLCKTFTECKERIQKFKTNGDSKYIYKNELDKSCKMFKWKRNRKSCYIKSAIGWWIQLLENYYSITSQLPENFKNLKYIDLL